MLFALRYERDGRPQISSLIQRCQDFGMSLSQLGVVRTILLQAGADKCVQGYILQGLTTVTIRPLGRALSAKTLGRSRRQGLLTV